MADGLGDIRERTGQPNARHRSPPSCRAIVHDLRTARMNTAADLVERSVSETLTYYAFPYIRWQKIRTNHPLERIMP
jgi:putative transposase